MQSSGKFYKRFSQILTRHLEKLTKNVVVKELIERKVMLKVPSKCDQKLFLYNSILLSI